MGGAQLFCFDRVRSIDCHAAKHSVLRCRRQHRGHRMDPVTLSLKDSENPGYDYSDPTDLDTEFRILHSDSLAWQVIKQLGLDKTLGAAPASSSSLGLTTDNQFDSDKASQMIASFKSNLAVILEPNTRIIDIHYRSPDKYLAARAVNALASAYVEQT